MPVISFAEPATETNLFDFLPDAAILLNSEQIILNVNKKAEILLEYTREELLGKYASYLLPGHLFDEQEENVNESFVRIKSGSILSAKTVTSCFDSHGQQIFFVTIRSVDTVSRTNDRIIPAEVVSTSEQHLRLIYNTISDIVFVLEVTDTQYIFNSVNQAFLNATGLTEPQIVGKFVSDVIPGNSLPIVLSKYDLAICGKQTVQWEETSDYPAGTKTGIVSVTPVFNPEGQCIILVGTVHDITARKKAERALRESETRLRTILNAEPECVKLLRRNGELEDMNSAGLSMIEADDIEQAKGASLVALVNEPYRDSFRDLMSNVFQGVAGVLDFEITGLKGTRRWLQTHAVPLRNADGNITFLLGLTRDITQHKHAISKLKESEEKYKTLVEQAADAIFIADPAGRFLAVNSSACKLAQFSEEELLNKTIYDFVVAEDIRTNPFHFDELRQGKTVLTTRAMKNKNGISLHVEVSARLLSDGRLLCFIRDISERIKSQEELKETSEQLQQLTAHLQQIREEERKRIGREIHDELGQQLTAIKMDVAWIDKRIQEPLPEIRLKLKNIITLLDESNQSIRRILSELRPGILDNYNFTGALEWLTRQFEANTGIPAKFSSYDATLRPAEQIALCLYRVYQEALTNISRHSQASKVTATITRADNTVVLSVEDNGIGFNMAAKKGQPSFGILGMRERVKSYGGKFELITVQGKGTELSVVMPAELFI